MNKRTQPKKIRPIAPTINDSLLTRESWKIFQVMAEFVEGYERLIHAKPYVSIFGSSKCQTNHKYYKLAQKIALELSNAGFSIVTGGGPGIMEGANKGAYQGNSFSIGLNIAFPHEKLSTKYQDITLNFRHFFTRKVMFVKYAAAYVVLPGGFGTLDELAEILALVQTKKSREIPILLVNKAFWAPLMEWFQNTLVQEKMITKKDLKLFSIVETPGEITKYILEYYKKHKANNYKKNKTDLNKSYQF